MLAREHAGTSVAGKQSAVRAERGDKGLRGSVVWTRMEAGALSHALTRFWISNTESSSEVSAVVIYITGGWTVLEEPGRVVLLDECQTRGNTSVVRDLGE